MKCRIIVDSHRVSPGGLRDVADTFLQEHPEGPVTSRVAPRTARVGRWREGMDVTDTRWGWLAAEDDELRWQTEGDVAIVTRVRELDGDSDTAASTGVQVTATTGNSLLLPRLSKVPVRVRTYRDDTGTIVATRWLTEGASDAK